MPEDNIMSQPLFPRRFEYQNHYPKGIVVAQLRLKLMWTIVRSY